MAIYAEETKADYSIADGKYPARLIQIIQLGSRKFEKNGKEWYSPQILLGFELPTLTYENADGETVSNIKSGTYFLSLNPSYNGVIGMREIIEGMIGSELPDYEKGDAKKYDISQLIGKECIIELAGVESKGKVYQNIVAVEKYPTTGEKLPSYRNPMIVSVDEFKALDMINLPDWIKDKIMQSKEYQEMTSEESKNIDDFVASLDNTPTGHEDRPLDF